MRKDKVFHVISNTHWDREWRFPFQRNRMMLVQMMDKAIEILENYPEYRAYHLDSQSIVVEDYLKIRPENKERFIKLVKQNRLLIGPWYVLPDEFLVGGENLIRNLLIGHKICSAYGGVSKIGYSPFSWGQISQLPQLYKEFGINLIMFYRGVNSLDSPKAEFIWEGADGTRALSSRFSTMPRYNFYFYIYRHVIHNEKISEIEYKWTRGGIPFHFADNEFYNEDYFLINPNDEYFKENLKEAVEAIIKNQADDFTTPHVIWMEGHDSSGPNEKTVRIIHDIKKIFPNIDVRHSTLEEYTKLLEENTDKENLVVVKGERRSSQYDLRSGNLYGYTTSARMYLKQKNFETEKWLQFYAEPFANLTNILGNNLSQEYLNIAWNLLVQNSSHDSIGGCSLDEIHEDMMYRFKQSIEISKGVFDQSCKFLGTCVDTTKFTSKIPDNNQIYLTAINPTQFPRSEVIEANIDIPEELNLGDLQIVDDNGSNVDLQINSVKLAEPVLEQLTNRPLYIKAKRYNCHVNLNDIPSIGFKTFQIIPTKKNNRTKKRKLVRLSNGLPILENDNLKVQINRNGTFNVYDKLIDINFESLGYFYDEGEAGHAWINLPAEPFITTLKQKPEINIIQKGNLSSSVSIKYNWRIPKDRLTSIKKRNNNSSVVLPIEVVVSLTKNSKRVDLKIKLNNNAENHRMRIMFPTNLNADYSFGEGQFDVVKRPIKRFDTKNWVEQPMYDYPLHHFVDVSDINNGCAVIVSGLKEYEVLDDTSKTIAITLMRAFTYVIHPSSKEDYSHKKGSQCLGTHEFHLSFYPHKGNWNGGKVYKQALNFNNDLRLFQTGKLKGNLSPASSFIQIEPDDLVFSCFKKSEDEDNSYILRIYNPTEGEVKGQIKLLFELISVERVSLEEKLISRDVSRKKYSFQVIVKAKEIQSFRLLFDK